MDFMQACQSFSSRASLASSNLVWPLQTADYVNETGKLLLCLLHRPGNMQVLQTCLLYDVLAGAEAHDAADVYTCSDC